MVAQRNNIGFPVSFDWLISGTETADTLTGSDNADQISGQGGDDFLYGNGGNDRLFGGAGNDTLHGGRGDDTMNGGAGGDTFIGGEGFDTVTYAGATSGIKINIDNLSTILARPSATRSVASNALLARTMQTFSLI